MELRGKHAEVLAIQCSTPTSSSLIIADQRHEKGQLEVIHSENPSWHPEMDSAVLGVMQSYLYIKARYFAEITFYARDFSRDFKFLY